MDPTPGTRPTQLANSTKKKIVAKNQNVRSAKCGPIMSARNLRNSSMSHSKKFCAPLGMLFIFLVAHCANRMSPAATIQLTTIELVIGNPKRRATSTAFGDKPCSAGALVVTDSDEGKSVS